MKFNDWLERLKNYEKNATPKEKWEGSGNVPFYVQIKKPAPSLSKHDSKCPDYWRYEDGEFLLAARWEMAKLLAVIGTQQKALENIIEHELYHGVNQGQPSESTAQEALRQCQKIIEIKNG